MKVTSLEATTCVVPLDGGIAIATRALTERHYTLVRIRTDSGAEGIGFCYGGNRGGALATLAVRDLLRDSVVGRDPHQVEAIWSSMFPRGAAAGTARGRATGHQRDRPGAVGRRLQGGRPAAVPVPRRLPRGDGPRLRQRRLLRRRQDARRPGRRDARATSTWASTPSRSRSAASPPGKTPRG